jgi:NTE family protein
MQNQKNLSLALTAGGARAAYQVGVLKYISENFDSFQPKIFTGVSAGSINASFLSQGEPPKKAIEELYSLWDSIEFNMVLQTNFSSLFSMAWRWVYDLFISRVTRKLLLKSLLDASPLAQTLLSHIHFKRISDSIKQGKLLGLAVTATNYYNGVTTVFYDSHRAIEPWKREQRIAVKTAIRVRHIMASCSIPILFEPVRIDDALFGDGSMRFGFPLSPSIRLGATHILAIGIRCPNPVSAFKNQKPDHLGMGFVAGAVLNSIFLDSLESDFENLVRINNVAGNNSPKQVQALFLRPSQDLGLLARDSIQDVPFHLRQLIKSTGKTEELGDLLSYLMFSQGYIRRLLKLGYEDAKKQHSEIDTFLKTL